MEKFENGDFYIGTLGERATKINHKNNEKL
jgi:hypothetical protein